MSGNREKIDQVGEERPIGFASRENPCSNFLLYLGQPIVGIAFGEVIVGAYGGHDHEEEYQSGTHNCETVVFERRVGDLSSRFFKSERTICDGDEKNDDSV